MATAVRQAFIGAGANLGDRRAAIAGAIARLRAQPGIAAVEASSIFETAPVGVVDQPMFLNAVLGVETTLSPEELLGALSEIERAFGRVRAEHWGPRTLDLDLLAFEGETRATAALELPHPRMLGRAFVTVPLRELLAHPRFDKACWAALRAQLESASPATGVKKVGEA